MTNEQRIKNLIARKPLDFLPSQITFSDRTRDKAISEALGLDSPDQLDPYLQNHIGFALTKYDECLFLRNDIELMRKLEKEGFVGVDVEGKTVYDCWGMGVMIGEDGFYTNYGILQGNPRKNERARKFLPKSVDQGVMDMALEDAVRAYKAPDPNKPGLWDDVDAIMAGNANGNLYIIPSGYFGVYERSYAIIGFENVMCESVLNPSTVEELFIKITDFKIEMFQAGSCARRLLPTDGRRSRNAMLDAALALGVPQAAQAAAQAAVRRRKERGRADVHAFLRLDGGLFARFDRDRTRRVGAGAALQRPEKNQA